MRFEEAAAQLSEISELVAPDGATLELISVDAATRSVSLKLDITGVECLECVMPRTYLENLALSIFRKAMPDLSRVTIIDPRDAAGTAAAH